MIDKSAAKRTRALGRPRGRASGVGRLAALPAARATAYPPAGPALTAWAVLLSVGAGAGWLGGLLSAPSPAAPVASQPQPVRLEVACAACPVAPAASESVLGGLNLVAGFAILVALLVGFFAGLLIGASGCGGL